MIKGRRVDSCNVDDNFVYLTCGIHPHSWRSSTRPSPLLLSFRILSFVVGPWHWDADFIVHFVGLIIVFEWQSCKVTLCGRRRWCSDICSCPGCPAFDSLGPWTRPSKRQLWGEKRFLRLLGLRSTFSFLGGFLGGWELCVTVRGEGAVVREEVSSSQQLVESHVFGWASLLCQIRVNFLGFSFLSGSRRKDNFDLTESFRESFWRKKTYAPV